MNGGRFDFDDGGTYCGGWEEGKAHGHGVCTGPQGKGEYAGAWHYGFEVSGVYTWPSGNTYQGQWQNGKRHGLGVEQRGRWIYKGEWTQGYKGRYGQRQSVTSQARYQGTWSAGFHDGYGTELYVDGGAYQGQWLRGMRHGYGVRKSAQHGVAAKFRSRSRTNASLTSLRSEYGEEDEKNEKKLDENDESRGGFVLKARSEAPTRQRSLSERSLAVKRTILSGLRIKKQHSTGDIHQRVTSGSLRSSGSTMSCTSDESEHRQGREHLVVPQEDHVDANTTEIYKGEWKNDKRCGFGVGERSDGLKYEGEWFNNRKCGYGITTFKDGRREEGKYKNNILVSSNRKKGLLFRSSRLRERVGNAVEAANRAATIAQQKADIAISRTATAKERAEQAEYVALQAREDADTARICAKQFAPEFKQPGTEAVRMLNRIQNSTATANHVSFEYPSSKGSHDSKDMTDEVVVLNSPPLPTVIPTGQIPLHAFNIASQGSTVSTALQGLSLGYQNANNSHQNAVNYQNPVPFYQQQAETTSSPYQTGSIPPSVIPSSYQVIPSSVSSIPYGSGSTAQASVTPLLNSTATNISSYLPNTVPHSVNVQEQHQQTYQANPVSSLEQQSLYPDHYSGTKKNANMNLENAALNNDQISSDSYTSAPRYSSPQSSKTFQGINQMQSSSRMSLSDDHYDQYMMSANPKHGGRLIRRNRPSLTRQPFAVHDATQNLYRRSTLASAGDKRLEEVKAHENSVDSEGRGSLPNLTELETAGIYLRREEAARLASRHRQELQRMIEEEELLRSNPLRYLFHPALRAWIIRWKMPLVLSVANIFLLMVFYNLLTYDKRTRERR